MRRIAEHIACIVAIVGTFNVTLRAQQPKLTSPPTIPEYQLDLRLFGLGVSPCPRYPRREDYDESFISSSHLKPSGQQRELPVRALGNSPFSSAAIENRLTCIPHWLPDPNRGSSHEDENTSALFNLNLVGLASPEDGQSAPPEPQRNPSPAEKGSPKHIFLLVPAFHVTYLKQFKPLTPHEKFAEWVQGTYDPRGLLLYAGEAATLEHSSNDGFCGYGHGFGSYGKCFGSMELDANISSFLGDFLFPVILHQDPRYFRRGEGLFGGRIGYAVSRVFVTHADSGRNVFFTSALSGSIIAAAASNLYYPTHDRGFNPSVHRLAVDLGDTALFNVAAEFWPDISCKLKRVF